LDRLVRMTVRLFQDFNQFKISMEQLDRKHGELVALRESRERSQ
jgi:hypothetical protein